MPVYASVRNVDVLQVNNALKQVQDELYKLQGEFVRGNANLYSSSGPATITYLAKHVQLPAYLTEANKNALFFIEEYAHMYRWLGYEWQMLEAAGYIVQSKDDDAPLGGVWALCNGSTVKVSDGSGGLLDVITPNFATGNRFIYGANPPVAAAVASAATFTGTAVTNNESGHTHSVDPPNSATTAPSAGGTVVVQSGAGATVAAALHQHSLDIAAFTSAGGSSHSHTIDTSGLTLNTPTEANGGLPSRIGMSFYIRQ